MCVDGAFCARAHYIVQIVKSTLLHVCDLISHNDSTVCALTTEIAELICALPKTTSSRSWPRRLPQTTCRRILRSRDAAPEIIDVPARTEDIDLIVMPTHVGQFRRLVLGSTTAKALAQVHCPVLTTKHAETIRSGATRTSSMGLRRKPNLRLGKNSCFCQPRSRDGRGKSYRNSRH